MLVGGKKSRGKKTVHYRFLIIRKMFFLPLISRKQHSVVFGANSFVFSESLTYVYIKNDMVKLCREKQFKVSFQFFFVDPIFHMKPDADVLIEETES